MSTGSISLGHPLVADGGEVHSLATRAGELDVNSSYAYLLWCRDFGHTSVVAKREGEVVGFVTGYHRPEEPTTLFVWQVAVDARARGEGLAGQMLDWLTDTTGAATMETTITADNGASIALFGAFTRRHGASDTVTPLFTGDDFPDGHDTEFLHRIGPLRTDG